MQSGWRALLHKTSIVFRGIAEKRSRFMELVHTAQYFCL
jgi:hypothetical protein